MATAANKIASKIAVEAVLERLNLKIFFVAQPWWATGIFRQVTTGHVRR